METTLTQACIASSSSIPVRHGLPYALGPIDESLLVSVAMQSEHEVGFVLWVPGAAALPASLFHSPELYQGAAAGYDFGYGAPMIPPQVANVVTRDFFSGLAHGDGYSWLVGFILGALAALAEENRVWALVGIAHVCFLVSRVPVATGPERVRAVYRTECLHNMVLRAYRGTVQALKAGGMRVEEAWKAALVPNTGQMASHAQEVSA